MSDLVICENLHDKIDEKTVAEVIEILSKFPPKATIDCGYYWDTFYMNVVIHETKEEKQARLAAEKAAKEAEKLEKRRQQYLKLKAEFEGDNT